MFWESFNSKLYIKSFCLKHNSVIEIWVYTDVDILSEQRKWGGGNKQPGILKLKPNQQFVWNGLGLLHVPGQSSAALRFISCLPPPGWGILDLVTRLMRRTYIIWSLGAGGVSVSARRRDSQTGRPSGGRQQRFRTGLCHFDREQWGPCWCQRDTRHSDEPSTPLPLALHQQCLL